MNIRNHVVFRDGHEEDVLFYKELPYGYINFVTESGIYFYNPRNYKFYTLGMRFTPSLKELSFPYNPYDFNYEPDISVDSSLIVIYEIEKLILFKEYKEK